MKQSVICGLVFVMILVGSCRKNTGPVVSKYTANGPVTYFTVKKDGLEKGILSVKTQGVNILFLLNTRNEVEAALLTSDDSKQGEKAVVLKYNAAMEGLEFLDQTFLTSLAERDRNNLSTWVKIFRGVNFRDPSTFKVFVAEPSNKVGGGPVIRIPGTDITVVAKSKVDCPVCLSCGSANVCIRAMCDYVDCVVDHLSNWDFDFSECQKNKIFNDEVCKQLLGF